MLTFSKNLVRRFPKSLIRLALCLGLGVAAGPGAAQERCSWTELRNPVRQVIVCGPEVKIEREPAADVTIYERPGAAPPRLIDVRNGAVLIEISPGGRGSTLVRSPHAIAAVRGTTYIVDAQAQTTSVFVMTGRVEVRRTAGAGQITLSPGEGIDVGPGLPLASVVWGRARADALLARFGR